MILLHIPGSPVAQPRAKATTINGHARMYTPSTANLYKASIALAATQRHPGPPFDGPLRLTISFVLPRPQRLIWKRRDMPREPHASKPDIDNMAKAVMDALMGIVWRDDSQVADLRVRKWIASGYEQPYTQILIEQITLPMERHDEKASGNR